MPKDRFEDHLAAVEQAVQQLESGNLPLEESIEKYEQGVKSLKKCYEILENAERKVQALVKNEQGEPETRPFEGEGGADAEEAPRAPRKGKRPSESEE